ncbi:hypothetical protein N2152v2_002150 [Parachlorella kessleri]
MPAELITDDQPRIKFQAERQGQAPYVGSNASLADLADLMAELEASGVIPTLNDGLAAGNCAIAVIAVESAAHSSSSFSASTAGAVAAAGDRRKGKQHDCPPPKQPEGMWVSRSGKQPGVLMHPSDFVLVTDFDRGSWSARYVSSLEEARPTSDSPLHAAALLSDAQAAYGWSEKPLVAVHGHALAEGAGLDLAQRLGFPISHEATLFSTPEDLRELEQLFAAHPYPQHRCYIRKGHGFFLLGRSVGEVRQNFRELILPYLEDLS